MAYPNGFEPSAPSVGGLCSIQLRYGYILNIFYQNYVIKATSGRKIASVINIVFSVGRLLILCKYTDSRRDNGK